MSKGRSHQKLGDLLLRKVKRVLPFSRKFSFIPAFSKENRNAKILFETSRAGHPPPKIIVKKEPTSPEQQSAKRRPQQLNLTNSAGALPGRPTGPLTKDSAQLGLHDVGIACLSPGFQTDDPSMQEQLQRSMSVREQQRLLIEARLQKNVKGTGDSGRGTGGGGEFSGGLKTPMTGRKRPPPPGLSIVPPSHEQFANERVIQSAPLHQTFTGRHHPHPLARTLNDPHLHAAPQTHHRLPPITDVFANEGLGNHRERPVPFHSNSASNVIQSTHRPPFPSPGLPPPPPAVITRSDPQSTRPREYRSAEEAIADMTSGREEHQPRIVHYGGHQPPTPPSPPSHHSHGYGHGHGITPAKQRHILATSSSSSTITAQQSDISRHPSGNGRIRPRTEYERDAGSPPLGSGPSPRRAFGERDSPATNQAKKEEFMRICARAWDLFHS